MTDPEYCDVVSSDIRREVTGAFIRLETALEDGENPIEKLEVIPSESQGPDPKKLKLELDALRKVLADQAAQNGEALRVATEAAKTAPSRALWTRSGTLSRCQG